MRERNIRRYWKVSKSPPVKKKDIVMNLRFILTVDEHAEFWHVGRKVLKLRTKKEILMEMIRIANEISK